MIDTHHFRATAARLNLGYLIICSGVAIAVLAAAPFIGDLYFADVPEFITLLNWLVLAQCGAVFFGATTLLMKTIGLGKICRALRSATVCSTTWLLLIVGGADAVILSQTFAAAMLAQAAICATYLSCYGVWPGITALFCRELRLF